jgi:hypothetical protein
VLRLVPLGRERGTQPRSVGLRVAARNRVPAEPTPGLGCADAIKMYSTACGIAAIGA